MKKILPIIVFALTVISCNSETIETEKIGNTVKVQNSVSINDKEESTLDNKTLENQQVSSFAKVKDGDCKGLHKVTSRDDLLQQMYATAFKSDCLYNMSDKELSKIWGIPVLDKNIVPRDPSDTGKFGWFPDVEHDYLVMRGRKDRDQFILTITKKGIRSGITTLFPKGSFPSVLPPAKIFLRPPQMNRSKFSRLQTGYQARRDDFIQHGNIYYWLSDNSSRVIYCSGQGGGAVTKITFLKDNIYPYLK